jgi:ribosomal protein S18 acetylase RimI-like enzyme
MSTPITTHVDYLTQHSLMVDIRQLTARELGPLLLEQVADWDIELDWDFSAFAELVRTFADARMLTGMALVDRGEVAGYGYTCLEEHKGLITDLYVRRGWRGGNAEAALFRSLLDGLIGTPGVRRVESQLMLLGADTARSLQRQRSVRLFERLLMKLDANTLLTPGRASTAQRFRIAPWSTRHYDAAAAVVADAHIGHIDTQINDQYRTLDGARRLLYNIVQFPGFCQPSSYTAFDIATGSAAGMVLSSFVSRDVAQITELCVKPDVRGAGLGYELLRQSVAALRGAGARRISLAVTAGNEDALRLYLRCGFRTARRFYAYVWDDCGLVNNN